MKIISVMAYNVEIFLQVLFYKSLFVGKYYSIIC